MSIQQHQAFSAQSALSATPSLTAQHERPLAQLSPGRSHPAALCSTRSSQHGCICGCSRQLHPQGKALTGGRAVQGRQPDLKGVVAHMKQSHGVRPWWPGVQQSGCGVTGSMGAVRGQPVACAVLRTHLGCRWAGTSGFTGTGGGGGAASATRSYASRDRMPCCSC